MPQKIQIRHTEKSMTILSDIRKAEYGCIQSLRVLLDRLRSQKMDQAVAMDVASSSALLNTYDNLLRTYIESLNKEKI